MLTLICKRIVFQMQVSFPHTLNAIYPSTDKQCALGFYEFFGSESLKDKGYIIRYFILDTTTSLINLDFEKKKSFT